MELFNNFSETFLSVWNKGILGVDILQILIGLGIFLIFLILNNNMFLQDPLHAQPS